VADKSDRSPVALIFLLIIFLLLSAFGCAHGPSIVARQKEKIASIPAGWDSSVVLLENRTELVFEAHHGGNRVKRKELIWAYVRKRNPNDLENLAFYDYETFEKPAKIKAWAHYPDGSRWSLQSQALERGKIPLDNAFVNEFSIPRYDEGVLIQIEIQRDYFHPEFIGTFRLRNRHPALQRTISLTFPEDCVLAYGLENPEKAVIDESIMVADGLKKIEVTAPNLEGVWDRWKTEFPEQSYAAFYVSFPPKGKHSYSWQQLGDRYLELSKEAFEGSAEIDAFADSVHGSTEKELIHNGFKTIVGKIRYHADEEGRFAFYPRKAETILKNGFGDCKEISTLLRTLLHSKKVETWPAMISTRNHRQPVEKYPSLANFNHMILAAGGANAPYHFLDGTHTFADANNSYFNLIGRTAFVLKPGGSQLVRVSAGGDYKNLVVTRSKVTHEPADGRWTIQGRIRLIGHPALRFFSKLQWSDTAEKKSLAKRYLQNEFGINPILFDYRAPDGNEVSFTYKALFQENYIAVGKGGFRLAVPRLSDTSADSSLDRKEGPVLLESFEQQDTWEFDQEPQNSRFNAFQLPFADCAFSVEGTGVTRTYRQKNELLRQEDAQLGTWMDKLTSVMNSTCWR
jgi:hypothetical protein